MRSDIVPGAQFPDFELTGTDKHRHKLSELQGNDPLVLILSRGHFCPKDHQQHLELASWQSAVAVAYTKVVTICSGNISDANSSPNQVLENAPNDTAVGIKALAVDADGSNSTITYSLTARAGGTSDKSSVRDLHTRGDRLEVQAESR